MSIKSVTLVFTYYVVLLMLHEVYSNQVTSISDIKVYEERELEELFLEFQERYDKSYASEEEYQKRFEV